MDDELKQRLTQESTWMRGLYMVLFIIINEITKIILMAVVIFQFLATLFTGRRNSQLLAFGNSLSRFIYQIVLFLTYNAEEKPFPFSSWPDSGGAGALASPGNKNKKSAKKQPKAKSGNEQKQTDTGDGHGAGETGPDKDA